MLTTKSPGPTEGDLGEIFLVPVTREMVRAGVEVSRRLEPSVRSWEEYVEAIYVAMETARLNLVTILPMTSLEFAPEYLEALTEGLEVGTFPPRYHPETQTLTSSGIKDEGEMHRKFFDTPGEAILAYAREFKKFTKGKKKIWWRRLPELQQVGPGPAGQRWCAWDKFVVRSRLFAK